MYEGSGQICDILRVVRPGSGGSELPVRQLPVQGIPAKGVPMTKILKTSAEGRRCTFLNCQRLLSIYNHQAYCRIHQEQLSAEESPNRTGTPENRPSDRAMVLHK
jgi:hypothetical protein